MHLRGQHGYAMVALLVGLSVAAVLATAVIPSWSQAARREKEEELVFRGLQYSHAIGLFQRKSGPGVLPPSVDVLVSQRFLRKKYKDPITGADFAVLSPVSQPAGPGTPTPGTPGPGNAGRGSVPSPPAQGAVVIPNSGRGVSGGVMGVASTSTDESLRIYNGRTHYNEWQFVYVARTQAPAAPDGRGGPGNGRNGGPGGPNAPVGPGGGRQGRGGDIGRGGPGPLGPGPTGRGDGPRTPFNPGQGFPPTPRP